MPHPPKGMRQLNELRSAMSPAEQEEAETRARELEGRVLPKLVH
jgi:hypothetical protein